MALTTMVAFGALGTVASGWIADRLVHLLVARALLAATIVSMLAVTFTPSPRVFLPIALTGFVLFQSFSLTVTLCQDCPPSHVGTSARLQA
jgi:predicted MFS family arabinose efflux permease